MPAGKQGQATIPLGLPLRSPKCFDSQKQWNLWREVAVYSAGDGFTYCTDCTPARRDQMIAEGRCAFPNTTFVKQTGGVIVGRRRK